MVNRIRNQALEKGNGQVRKVMAVIRAKLDDLGKRVEAHRRANPTPTLSMRTYDDMDAPARSLAHLQVCAGWKMSWRISRSPWQEQVRQPDGNRV